MIPLQLDTILLTKVRPPVPRAGGISRERLLQRLTRGLRGRLTLVSAPAGFGKTTLLGQWAQVAPAAVAWYSLDETDSDLMKFWRTFARALQPFAPPGLDGRMDALLQAYPSASIQAILDSLLNELGGLTDKPLAVVLDDYHTIADPRIHESLGYFVERAPAGVHLVIAGRIEPPLPAAKWKARGELHELTARQLSFTVEEAGRFCRETAGLPLSDERIGLLMRWTEGWAASLQLVSLSLGESDDWDRFFAQFRGADRSLTQYLLEEVFAGLPSGMQVFLLRTSVLTQFDAAVCDAVTLGSDGARMLSELAARNLFLTPLDAGGTWFRYHHLFSLFLREQLAARSPELLPWLHGLAAEHLAARDMTDMAMEHALEAQNTRFTVRLLAGHVRTVLEKGELGTLLRWLQRIPPEAVPAPLALLHAFALIVTGQIEGATAVLRRIELALAEMEPSEEARELQSGLFFVKANLAFGSSDYEQWFAFAERLPGMLPESPAFYYLNYNTSEPFVRRTMFGLKGRQNASTEAIAMRMTDIMEAHGWGRSFFTLYILQSLAEGYYEWDRFSDSEALLRRIEPFARRQGVPGLLVPNRLTSARLCWAAGDREAAYAVLEDAREELRAAAGDSGPGDGACWTRHLLAAEAVFRVRDGNLAAAEKLLFGERGLGVMPQDKPTPFDALAYTALARLLGARRKEKEALKLLEELKRQSVREDNLAGLAEIAALQALIEAQRGRRTAAFALLAEALAAGEPNGYVRTFVDEGKPMESLLRQYAEQLGKQRLESGGAAGQEQSAAREIAAALAETAATAGAAAAEAAADAAAGAETAEAAADAAAGAAAAEAAASPSVAVPAAAAVVPSAAYVARLLAAFPRSEPAAARRELVEPLTAKEQAVLLEAVRGAGNREIAARLHLTEGTVKVYLSRIYAKLGVTSRIQALHRAEELGLFELE